jgi:uncharacterized protein (TIGR00369 family)
MKKLKTKPAQTRAVLRKIPFDSLLGMELSKVHSDGITLRCQVRKKLLNKAGALHGGVAASLADAAVGVAIHHRFGGKRPISTVELKVNYFRPVTAGAVFARARLLRIGSTLCVGRVDLTDEQDHVIGVALVTYIFLDARGGNSNGAGSDG